MPVAMQTSPRRSRTRNTSSSSNGSCAIDVAKASGKVCTRVPHPATPGRRVSQGVGRDGHHSNAVTELGDHLAGQGIEKVTVESTSDYWRIWFYLLEARGLDVQLVNARDVKNVPGRPKTDKLDAVWLAKLTEKGLLRPSFVPPGRDPGAARLHPDAGRPDRRTHPALAAAGEAAGGRLIKVSSVASTLDTALDPGHDRGADRRRTRPAGAGRVWPAARCEPRHAALIEALTGRFDDHHAELPAMLLDQIDGLNAQIAPLTTRIEELLAASPAAQQPPTTTTRQQRGPGEHARRWPRSPVTAGAAHGWTRSPASARTAPRSSWPRSAWT